MATPEKIPYSEELFDSVEEAANSLGAMVLGAIESGSQPPTPIFRWFCMHSTYLFMQVEEMTILHNDAPVTKEQEQEVNQAAAMVAVLLKHARKHKMFALENEIVSVLNVRKMRYPTTMDMTYGGNLP